MCYDEVRLSKSILRYLINYYSNYIVTYRYHHSLAPFQSLRTPQSVFLTYTYVIFTHASHVCHPLSPLQRLSPYRRSYTHLTHCRRADEGQGEE